MAGYHNRDIPRGEFCELSKITEEYHELLDAAEQDNVILILCELADLVGAIEGYAEQYCMTMTDLLKMKDATKRAFEDGSRTTTSKDGDFLTDEFQSRSSLWASTKPGVFDPEFDDVFDNPKINVLADNKKNMNIISVIIYISTMFLCVGLLVDGISSSTTTALMITLTLLLAGWLYFNDRIYRFLSWVWKL